MNANEIETNNSNTKKNNWFLPITTISSQAMLFGLKDWDLCNAMPNLAVLSAINNDQLKALRRSRVASCYT